MERDLIFLKPYFTHNIWGGTKLRDEYGYDVSGDVIGECWGIAAHENGESTVSGGDYDGLKLSELWSEHKELFGNDTEGPFPLLIKIIDAKEDLSIQVHPDNAYAAAHENGSLGKDECWYVLSAEPGAALIVGHNAGSKEELRQMIEERRFEELVREIPVKKGDFVEIKPGTVHAIKGGITVLETQQSSDITYRLYDYDRVRDGKKRELHIDKCLDVITVPAPDTEKLFTRDDKSPDAVNGFDDRMLLKNEYFEVHRLIVNGSYSVKEPDRYRLMTVTEGEGTVNTRPVKKGSFFIVPVGTEELNIEGKITIIWSRKC